MALPTLDPPGLTEGNAAFRAAVRPRSLFGDRVRCPPGAEALDGYWRSSKPPLDVLLKQERLRRLRPLLLDGDHCTGVPLAQLFERCGLPYYGASQRACNRLYGGTLVHIRHWVRGSRG